MQSTHKLVLVKFKFELVQHTTQSTKEGLGKLHSSPVKNVICILKSIRDHR